MSLSLVPFLFVVTACIPDVAAAGPLNVNPVNTVTFSLYIALIAYTLFQAFRAFGILQRPQPRSGPNEIPFSPYRVPYAKIFLSTLTLLACYILQVIWIPIDFPTIAME
ncbi:hypothetical protein Hypma_013909 [Hypsizygus marmoreus]|uniref:Uncharacterized protein n=1 Tax=Hypsizygus marmoreus TaxID=39966 RepID=A0A369K649_HYPMA|nr:hypothetical protein Hypma_013909 [Hypsizygus marmoreus]